MAALSNFMLHAIVAAYTMGAGAVPASNTKGAGSAANTRGAGAVPALHTIGTGSAAYARAAGSAETQVSAEESYTLRCTDSGSLDLEESLTKRWEDALRDSLQGVAPSLDVAVVEVRFILFY